MWILPTILKPVFDSFTVITLERALAASTFRRGSTVIVDISYFLTKIVHRAVIPNLKPAPDLQDLSSERV